MNKLRYVGIGIGDGGSDTSGITDTVIDFPRGTAGMGVSGDTEIEIEEGFGRSNLSKRASGYSTEGSAEFSVDVNGLTYLMYLLLGKDGYTYDDATTTHKFVGTGNYIPTFFSLLLGSDFTELRYDSAALTSLSLSVEDGKATASVNILAGQDSTQAIRAREVLNNKTLLPLMFHETEIYIDGVLLGDSKSISLDIEQNGEVQHYLGSRLGTTVYGARAVSGTFTRNFTDTSFLTKFWGGGTKGGTDQESSTFALKIVMTRNNGEGTITIELPKTYIKSVKPSANGRDAAKEEIEFGCLEDSTSGTDIKVSIKNELPTL